MAQNKATKDLWEYLFESRASDSKGRKIFRRSLQAVIISFVLIGLPLIMQPIYKELSPYINAYVIWIGCVLIIHFSGKFIKIRVDD